MEVTEQFRHRWLVLLGISILTFAAYMDTTIADTALPFIKTALKATILQLQWVANIFTVILGMTMIAIGKLADLVGKRRVFTIGVILFALAALGAGFSQTVEMLVFFRGLQALGAATLFIISSSLLADVFPEEERLRVIGIYGAVAALGLMMGPFLGGILIGFSGWRWVFWINLPLIAIGLTLCSFSLRGLVHEKQIVKIDWTSLFLLVFGLGSLMFGIVSSAQNNWKSPLAWISLGFGAFALFMLVLFEGLKRNSLLDLDIFKDKLVVLTAISCALAGVVSSVFMFFDPLYLRIVCKLSAFKVGLLIAIIPAAQAAISFLFSWSVKRIGVANLLFFSIIAAFIAVGLHRMIDKHTHLSLLIIPYFLLGVNWGISNSAMTLVINDVIAPERKSSAYGTISTIWNVVGAVLLAASTAVFHFVEIKSSFLPAFYQAIHFNIGFASILLCVAIWVRLKLSRQIAK